MQYSEEYVEVDEKELSYVSKNKDFLTKIIYKVANFIDGPYWIVFVIILLCSISFMLGRISKIGENRERVRIINNSSYVKIGIGKEVSVPMPDQSQTAMVENSLVEEKVEVVGSKNGTKYHLPSCPGAKQISEKNLIKFKSIEEARSRGYTPASNCKGLR